MRAGRRVVVMAIFPNTRGFGYAVFEDILPVDWGVSGVGGSRRNDACIRRVTALLEKYNPDILLLRDSSEARSSRIARLIHAIAGSPRDPNAACIVVSRRHVRQAFGYLARPTRPAIARAIAARIPFFEPLLPPVRKIWNGEDRRMGLFDAVALALTYLESGFKRVQDKP
jgi:hypothetical protein